MSPSESRELLYTSGSSSDLEICAPISIFSDSSLDLRHLKTTCLSENWNEPEYLRQNSEDTTADEESIEPLELKDNTALRGDLRFILTMPEMCDVKFLVGRRETPMYGVRAILASRSRAFFDMIAATQNAEPAQKWKGRAWLISQIKKLAKKDLQPTSGPLILEIPDFEPTVFRHVLTYIQTGNTDVGFGDVIGVMNAADVYSLDGLRSACLDFARQAISRDTVLSLLVSTEPYSNYKWTKLILLEISKFICEKAQDILRHDHFQNLSEQSAVWVLTKPDLRATEEVKWDAVLRWSVHNGGNLSNKGLCDVLLKLTSGINFCDISLTVLKKEIRPLGFLPDDVINKAISHQRSPRLIIGQEKSNGTNQKSRNGKPVTGSNRPAIPDIPITADCFHMQPLASSTFDSSRDFSDSLSGGSW